MDKRVVIEQEELDCIDRLGRHYREHPEDFRKISSLSWVDGYLVGTYEPNMEEAHDDKETMEAGLEVNPAEPRSGDLSTWTGEIPQEEDTHDDGSSIEAELEGAQVEPESDRLPAWMNDDSHMEEQDLASLGEGGRKLLSTLHRLRRMKEEKLRIREGLTALEKNVEKELLELCRGMEQDRIMRRMIDETADGNDEEEEVPRTEDITDRDVTEGRLELNQAEQRPDCGHTSMVEGALAKRPRDNIANGSNEHLVEGPRTGKDKIRLPVPEGTLPWGCTTELWANKQEVTAVGEKEPVTRTLTSSTLDRPGGPELVENDDKGSEVCRRPNIQEEDREAHRQQLEEKRLGRWTKLMDTGEPPDSPPKLA
jgi:hypothetical protein